MSFMASTRPHHIALILTRIAAALALGGSAWAMPVAARQVPMNDMLLKPEAKYGEALESSVIIASVAQSASAISTGGTHTCALTNSGGVKCWGGNDWGALGDGTTARRLTPVDVVGLGSGVHQIAVGAFFTCALTDSGGVLCWGRNFEGQLGNGTTISSSVPVPVIGLETGVRAISNKSAAHACALIHGGGVKCWGRNDYRQLGDGTTVDRNVPVDVIGLGSGVSAIVTNNRNNCALMPGTGVMCWGDNQWGQLGDGYNNPRDVPVNVVGLGADVSQIAAGSGHNCALMANSTVKCWGHNLFGALGDGTTTHRHYPVNVVGLDADVAEVSAGTMYTCVRTGEGGIKCFGWNLKGQLGDGTTTDRIAPVNVTGLDTGATVISADFATCAIVDGTPRCWGFNSEGQLGNGTMVNSTVPVTVSGFADGGAIVHLLGFEITQAVQDLRNSVVLIERRPTTVRVHLKSLDGDLSNVTGVLSATRAGVPLPGSPMKLTGHTVRANPSRGMLYDSMNFAIPLDWASGTVDFGFGMSTPGTLECREPDNDANTGNNNDCHVTVSFEATPDLQVKFVEVPWKDGSGMFHGVVRADVDAAIHQLETTMPIAQLDSSWAGRLTTLSVPLDEAKFVSILNELQLLAGSSTRGSIYVGLIPGNPTSTLNGAAYLGQPVATSILNNRLSLAHEVGHSLGREHTYYTGDEGEPGYHEPQDGTISRSKDGFAANTVFGYAQRLVSQWSNYTRTLSGETADLMSYGTLRWPSPWTYSGMRDGITSRFGPPSVLRRDSEAQRALLVQGSVSLTRTTGSIDRLVQVTTTNALDMIATGEYTMRQLGADGNILATHAFTPQTGTEGAAVAGFFTLLLGRVPGLTSLELRKGSDILAIKSASQHDPSISLLLPEAGQTLTGSLATVHWSSADADGDPLMHIVQFSRDGGATWDTLATDIVSDTYEVDLNQLPGTIHGRFRVLANDGFNTSQTESTDDLILGNHAPSAAIAEPEPGTQFVSADSIALLGEARDLEDGEPADALARWDSSLNGLLGVGRSLVVNAQNLAVGQHVITFTQADSGGLSTAVTSTLKVVRVAGPRLAELVVAPGELILTGYLNGGSTPSQTLALRNIGDGPLAWGAQGSQPWLSICSRNGPTPANVEIAANPAGLVTGTYTATVVVTSTIKSSPAFTIPVTLFVGVQPPRMVFLPVIVSP